MSFTDYPHFRVTTLPPGTCIGAEDSTKTSMSARKRPGRALKTGVPMTPSKNPKNRKRKRR